MKEKIAPEGRASLCPSSRDARSIQKLKKRKKTSTLFLSLFLFLFLFSTFTATVLSLFFTTGFHIDCKANERERERDYTTAERLENGFSKVLFFHRRIEGGNGNRRHPNDKLVKSQEKMLLFFYLFF